MILRLIFLVIGFIAGLLFTRLVEHHESDIGGDELQMRFWSDKNVEGSIYMSGLAKMENSNIAGAKDSMGMAVCGTFRYMAEMHRKGEIPPQMVEKVTHKLKVMHKFILERKSYLEPLCGFIIDEDNRAINEFNSLLNYVRSL